MAKKALPMRRVPCNGCTLCCQGDAIRLEPEDDPSAYLTDPHPYIAGALMLRHTPSGACIYVGERGCTIHGRAPSLCRAADCRGIALRLDFQSARALHLLGRLDMRVWDQGRKRLEEAAASASAKKRSPAG